MMGNSRGVWFLYEMILADTRSGLSHRPRLAPCSFGCFHRVRQETSRPLTVERAAALAEIGYGHPLDEGATAAMFAVKGRVAGAPSLLGLMLLWKRLEPDPTSSLGDRIRELV